MTNLNMMQKCILLVGFGIIVLLGLFPSWACCSDKTINDLIDEITRGQPVPAPVASPVDAIPIIGLLIILMVLAVVFLIFYFNQRLPWLGERLGEATRRFKKAHKAPHAIFKQERLGRIEKQEAWVYAGFWKRVGAYFIDVVVLFIILVIFFFWWSFLGFPTSPKETFEGLVFLISLIFLWIYFATMESSKHQATLGKMAMNIVVTGMEKKPISIGRASGRYLAKAVPFVILIIFSTLITLLALSILNKQEKSIFLIFFAFLVLGVLIIINLMPAFTQKKQGLHDIIAGTLVLNKESAYQPGDIKNVLGTPSVAPNAPDTPIEKIPPQLTMSDSQISEQEKPGPIEKKTKLPSITQPQASTGISLENETKKCLYCGEIIKIEAKKCRFCGKIFDLKEVEREIEERQLGIYHENETKNCPMCAEIIKFNSNECELCGEMFDPDEVQRQVEERRVKLYEKAKINAGFIKCPTCNKWSIQKNQVKTGFIEDWCPHCPKVDLGDRATALQKAQDWPGLLTWCRQWTRAKPDNNAARFNLGFAYEKVGRYSNAIAAYREALRLKPDDANAWFNLGVTYRKLGRAGKAIEAYREALRLKPDYADAWNNLAVAYRKVDRFQEAIEAYQKAVHFKPDFALAWYNFGFTYGELGRHQEAIEPYRETVRLTPDNAEAWEVLGNSLKILGHYKEAIEAWREVIRLKPDSAEAWYDVALTYVQTGTPSAALEAIKELRRLDPQKAEKLFNLIMKP